ncbi:MAG TPA: hypothetical protein VFN35_15040 [Ktedonobacteraceae bacterium]|nr:hypothetical protein [Ktedonobacteraceae bacterium]
MQQEPTIEQRLSNLESLVAELRRKQADGEDVDQALLRRIDMFINDMHLLKNSQSRGFEAVLTSQREQKTLLQTQGRSIDALIQGQEQLIAFLMGGKPPRND